MRRFAGSSSPVLGGLTLFTFAASGAVTVLLARAQPPRAVLLFGTAALAGGVAFTLLAIGHASLPLFFVGLVISGAGFGSGFQGAIRTVLPLAGPHDRAGVLSILYIVAYLAMGLPAVLGGLRVAYGGGVIATAHEYGWAVIALAMVALIGAATRRAATTAATPNPAG